MRIKKISIISLICIMCFTFMPMNLYALEGEDNTADVTVVETTPEEVVTEDVIVKDATLQPLNYTNDHMQAYDLREYSIKDDSFNSNNRSISPKMSKVAQDKLNANEKKLYNLLLPELTKVADGNKNSGNIEVDGSSLYSKKTYTKEELGVPTIAENGTLTEDAYNSIFNVTNINLTKVIFALLADRPYDLYWFDKTEFYTVPSNINLMGDANQINVENIKLTFEFNVTKDYSKTGATKTADVNTSKTSADSAMVKAKAKEIVNQATSGNKTHYEILKAYMDFVCGNTDYNTTVQLTDDYGNPWQLIWVFDNDPNTKVVCEGYSKAFKYLCDLTPELTNDGIEVYLMQGDLGGSGIITPQPHMWNVVHMNNGKNYLVDPTNMDDMEWTVPNLLFMVGAAKESGTTGDKYSFVDGKGTITVTYDENTMSIYNSSEKDLDSANYDPSSSTVPSNPTPTDPTPTDPTTPGTTDPGTTDPTVDPTQPTTEDPTVTDPTTDDPVVEDPTEDPNEDPEGIDGENDGQDVDVDDGVIDEEEDSNEATAQKGANVVKTGDDNSLTLYLVVLIVAIAALIGLVVYNRKKNKKE